MEAAPISPDSVTPYRLGFGAGWESWQLKTDIARHAGFQYQVNLGRDFRVAKRHRLFAEAVFRHAWLHNENSKLRRLNFGGVAGYTLEAIPRWLQLHASLQIGASLYYFNDFKIRYRDEKIHDANAVPAFFLGAGAGVALLRESLNLSWNWQKDFGLRLPEGDASSPSSFQVQAGVDFAKLADLRREGLARPDGKRFARGLRLGFLADAAYTYNFARPASGENQLRGYETRNDRPMFHVAQAALTRACDDKTPLGFGVNLDAGENTKLSAAAHSLKGSYFDFQQLWGEACLPLGRGLRLRGGKFATFIGNEVIEPINHQRSLSWLFTYGIPFTHAGLRGEYSFSDRVTMAFGLVNGWDNFWGVQSGPAGMLGFTVQPNARVIASFNTSVGQEGSGLRSLVDGILVLKLGNFRLINDFIWGRHHDAAQTAHWVAGHVSPRYDFRQIRRHPDLLGLSGRGEFFWDPQGARTGTAQTLGSGALTLHLRPWKSAYFPMEVRMELRQDFSTESVFEKQERMSVRQTTLGVGVTLYYENLLLKQR